MLPRSKRNTSRENMQAKQRLEIYSEVQSALRNYVIFEIYTYNCRVSCLITCILAVSFDFVLLCCGLVLTACHVLIVSVVVSPPSLFPCSLAHLLSHRVLVYLLLIVPLCFAVFCQTVVLTASIVIVTAPLCALSYPWALPGIQPLGLCRPTSGLFCPSLGLTCCLAGLISTATVAASASLCYPPGQQEILHSHEPSSEVLYSVN